MSLEVGHSGPKCGPPSMGQVQWRTATNPLHTYQMHEGPVGTFHENDKTRIVEDRALGINPNSVCALCKLLSDVWL